MTNIPSLQEGHEACAAGSSHIILDILVGAEFQSLFMAHETKPLTVHEQTTWFLAVSKDYFTIE